MTKGLNEKDKLQEMLTSEKELVKVYGTYLTESSICSLREMLKTNMFEVSSDQFAIFKEMSERNYYKTKDATPIDLDNAITKFGQTKSEID